MQPVKADMIARLRADILLREGLQKTPGHTELDMGLGMMNTAFPDQVFPVSAVHEFICSNTEDKAASAGFIAGLLSKLLKRRGACIWISSSQHIYPPALCAFGIDPQRIVFTNLSKEKEQLWMMEEALKCDSLSAVVGDIRNLDFTASRRLQLAVEQSKVTGFLIRQTKHLNTTACVSRWRVRSAASVLPEGMPGVGFPRWQVELLKIRNGKPGAWTLEWRNKNFRAVIDTPIVYAEEQRKIV
jgi:protein ImuA